MLSEKLIDFIANADAKLNVKAGWEENELQRRIKNLFDFKRIECGWRQSCGTTDRTQFTHREWVKVIKKLRAEGLIISEETQKHGNAYATSKGGFWQSIVYTLV